MFTLLKLLKPLLLPFGWLMVGIAVTVVLIARGRRRAALVTVAIVFGAAYVLALEPVAYGFLATLERPYVASAAASMEEQADVIVVLAGGAFTAGYERPAELVGASFRRLWRAIELQRAHGGALPILYAGGSGDPFATVSHEAELAQTIARAAGVPAEYFWIETTSRNTYENGVEVRAVLASQFAGRPEPRILLVTSAWHLPRAIGVFRKLNMEVHPAPADFATHGFSIDPLSFLPTVDNFAQTSTALHEWIGIMGYRIRGWL